MNDFGKTIDLRAQMDAIYRDIALEKIPWNVEAPPSLLVDLVDSGRIAPCDAVDLGCGAGNYAAWLATKGFTVTGIDLSSEAIGIARSLAASKGAACRFVAGDLIHGLPGLADLFDFAYDWEVLHHVFPEDRPAYVSSVHRMLRVGATWLSVSFSENDRGFGGTGKVRTTSLGTVLYFSSEDELRALFEPLFDILELGTFEITGKFGSHLVVRALMRRR